MQPATTPTVLIHRANVEGALIVDALTGLIAQPLDERPDWAEGLSCALLAERLNWYSSRLSPEAMAPLKRPEAIAYEDLGWVAVDAEGEPFEQEADAEHRMATLAELLGVSRPDDLSEDIEHTHGRLLATADVEYRDPERTQEEASALEDAATSGFGDRLIASN